MSCKQENLRLRASEPVVLDDGVTLPPGVYWVCHKWIDCTAVDGSPKRVGEKFILELTVTQIADYGGRVPANYAAKEFDLSQHLRAGSLTVV